MATQFDGAVINEQGTTFGIAVVNQSALQDQAAASSLIQTFEQALGVSPVVLMTQDGRGVPTYTGRPDIVAFLSRLDPRRIPWKRYTFG